MNTQFFFIGAVRKQFDHIFHEQPEVICIFLNIQFSGFNFRIIEHVIQCSHHGFIACLHNVNILMLAGCEICLGEQFGHSNHTVHRRADFMAYGCHEIEFGPVGIFGNV